MQIVERGHGAPLVIVPGIQGRWEWTADAIEALAQDFRVLTFSLADEPTAQFERPRDGIDGFADQIEAALDARGIARTALCGISFGGVVALRFAARCPERVSALALVSAPGPDWHLKPRHAFFARHPMVFGPLFLLEAAGRLRFELGDVFATMTDRCRFVAAYAGTALRAPGSPARMAARALALAAHDRRADAAAVACPTLVMHGEPARDHVVDAGGTRAYAASIRGAETALLTGTGHLGFATRPREFARLLTRFFNQVTQGVHDSAA